MEAAVFFIVVLAGVSASWVFPAAMIGSLAGISMTRVTLFIGPRVPLAQIGDVDIGIGVIPIGSSVEFVDVQAVEDAYRGELRRRPELDEPALDMPEAEQRFWEWLPSFLGRRSLYEWQSLPVRLSIHLAGWLPVMVFAQLVLGFNPALEELSQGFKQVPLFLLDMDYARFAVEWLRNAAASGDWRPAAATISMKVLAVHLLPLPFLTGGELIRQVVCSVSGRPWRWPERWMTLSFLMTLVALAIGIHRALGLTV